MHIEIEIITDSAHPTSLSLQPVTAIENINNMIPTIAKKADNMMPPILYSHVDKLQILSQVNKANMALPPFTNEDMYKSGVEGKLSIVTNSGIFNNNPKTIEKTMAFI